MRQISIILSLIISLSLSAQDHSGNWCGSFNTPETRALQDEKLSNSLHEVATGSMQSRQTVYVPVKFHLAARNDGSGRISETRVLDQLCELNEDYAPYEIQFFLADGTFNYINNTALYENHLAVQNSVMEPQKDSRALNIFIVESVDDGNSQDGVTLAYYHTVRDWVVTRKASVRANDIAISHEVGHFFSLDHTFYGWEPESYTVLNDPAPSISSSGNILTELMNGNNCNNAADRICDTPPDYGFSNPCNFTANVLDPNGTRVEPDETNYMGYFLSCTDDDYHFSDMQSSVMRANYNSSGRNYLRIDPVPTYVEITETPVLVYPTSGGIADYYDHLEFEWTAVNGATMYLIEISRVSSFTVNPIYRFVTGTSTLVEELDANKQYYWRVRPLNAHIGCAAPSATQNFQSGIGTVATNEIPNIVSSFSISPNPINKGRDLNINIQLNETLNGSLRLIDATGRLVKSINTSFTKGDNHQVFPTSNLPNGLYILQLHTHKGQVSRKLIVNN